MKQFLRQLIKVFGYTAAALVILLAVVVGLFRLFLPRLPEYQEDIKLWASDAIGMHVEFSDMDARWGLSGPELVFYDTELVRPENQTRAIAAEVVSVGISLGSLVFDRAFVVDRIAIRDTSIEVRQLENGGWWIQGTPLDELPAAKAGGRPRFDEMEILGENVEIRFLQPGDERPRFIQIPNLLTSIDENRIAFDASVRLPPDLGRDVTLSATQLLGVPADERSWDLSVEARGIELAGWTDLHSVAIPRVLSGVSDVDVSLIYANGGIRNAVAEIDIADASVEGSEAFDLTGRFELDIASDGWFVVAEEFRLETGDHEWPETSLRVEASTGQDGHVVMIAADASYLNLADVSLVIPWLGAEQQQKLRDLAPTGIITELDATLYDWDAETPQFEVSASFSDLGFAAFDKVPGVRGLTGLVSTDHNRGRVEISSTNMQLDLQAFLDEPIDIVAAFGTIMWRSDANRTLVMTDSLQLSTPIFESRSNGDLTISSTGDSPHVALDVTWSISDIAVARQYLPRKVMKPKLYDWFQTALVKGSIPRGTLRFNGPLDKFPYENGEGEFLVESSVRDMTMKYHPAWPAAEQADVEVVLHNTRLYSVRNRSSNTGNQAVDSNIEIANLKKPVLRIDGLITGTLETFRQFVLQSPINDYTGGNLGRVSLSGDASFNLGLVVPLKDAKSTTLNGLLRSNNGTLAIEGFKPPLTDLIGEVQITRDEITSESLGARFLGEEVSLQLRNDEDPAFYTVASAQGTTTSRAIVEELGLPLEGLIDGVMEYEAQVFFPAGKQEVPAPLTIQIDSNLVGMALDFPEPVGKPAASPLPVSGDIRFLPGVDVIESAGSADNGISWQLAFNSVDGAWDFDRGVIYSGPGEIEPAETRGLHIRGNTSTVRLDEWLNLSRGGEKKVGAADRIRSVDLTVENLFALGQHLEGHHVRVDRSARDWLVQVDGDHVQGSIFVPYDFSSDRAMVLDMELLRLPGDDVTPPSESTTDPRSLPSITLTAKDLQLGDHKLGAVDASFIRTERGLESEKLVSRATTFEIVGAGRWVADENEPLGSRTYVTATLNSSDVEQTLSDLDFAQGISGESMGVLLDMSWAGGPRGEFLDALDGKVQVRMEEGQLEEVEPGAGRVLGLVSFVALPRRLSLDFSDVFNRGFGYDTISGSFTVVKGNASTCDLSLEGPAADVGIVGQANLALGTYEQGAVISANVGNTLPIVGAVVGGPPGAAAMLIFSQIFKKPLQEVGQVFYGISGPFDYPEIESVSSQDFVRYGELAGCLPQEGQE